VLLTGGSEQSRDLPVPAATSTASTSPWSSCPSKTRSTRATSSKARLRADGKHVIVIGGGDTGVRLRRHQQPARRRQCHAVRGDAPAARARKTRPMTWPYWPLKLRTSSSHEEGCERDVCHLDQGIHRRKGQSHWPQDRASRVEGRQDGRSAPAPKKTTRPTWCCWPWASSTRWLPCLKPLVSTRDARGNAKASAPNCRGGYSHQCAQGLCRPVTCAAGRAWWCGRIREGRQAARAVDEFF